MKTDELNHNIDELKYAYSFWSLKMLTVHKGLFEDELEDSIHKRKAEVKRKKKKPPTTLRLCNPLLLGAYNNKLGLSIPGKYGYQYKTKNTQSYTIHLQQK